MIESGDPCPHCGEDILNGDPGEVVDCVVCGSRFVIAGDGDDVEGDLDDLGGLW
jgi:hypothetical protein